MFQINACNFIIVRPEISQAVIWGGFFWCCLQIHSIYCAFEGQSRKNRTGSESHATKNAAPGHLAVPSYLYFHCTPCELLGLLDVFTTFGVGSQLLLGITLVMALYLVLHLLLKTVDLLS